MVLAQKNGKNIPDSDIMEKARFAENVAEE